MLYALVFGLIFLAAGMLFFTGKALAWVKGWQLMPEEEKRKIAIGPLCHNIGIMLLLAGAIFTAAAVFPAFRETAFRWVMVGWLVVSGLDILFIGKSKRYIAAPAQGRK